MVLAYPPVDIHIKMVVWKLLSMGGHSVPLKSKSSLKKEGSLSLVVLSHRTTNDTGFLRFYQLFQRYLRSYEGSVPVYGRGIYIIKDDSKPKDPVELATVSIRKPET